MMNAIRASFTKNRSRMFKFFGSSSQLASLERAKHFPFTEEPNYYKAGGFHPISLGDKIGPDQYIILRKLGYGQYSTVWLARDSK